MILKKPIVSSTQGFMILQEQGRFKFDSTSIQAGFSGGITGGNMQLPKN
jgi:hypothetical protein